MRDATDYYNLLSDTLKNGLNQVKYLYGKVENAKLEGKYINIRTGCLIQEKDSFNNNYFFNYDQDFPLCYYFSYCGLARKRVIKKIMDFYLSCLKEYDISQDEESMKEKIRNELELAKNDYEYLNKNNKGYNDLKLYKTIPQQGESESDNEVYVNSSSFINDESVEDEDENSNSFIDNKSIEEEKEKKKKCRLMKNGKKVVNEYKKELDDLLEEDNYEGEDDLNNEENEEEEDDNDNVNEEDNEENNENNVNNSNINSSKKKKKLYKSKLLNRKKKRNVISDSDEEDSHEEINEEEIQNFFKKYEDKEEKDEELEKKKNSINKEYLDNLKENMNLRQSTLDAFLK